MGDNEFIWFNQEDLEKDKWDALIEAIFSGNVVPVIGPDIICDYPDGSNINEYIIKGITDQLNLDKTIKTFSQLVYDPEFLAGLAKNNIHSGKEIIYKIVNNIFERNIEKFQPSTSLIKLLSTKLFPFVITTNYSPVVENAMKKIWGDQIVRTMYFCNNPRNDNKTGVGDIQSPDDMLKPTIYHMFGKTSSQPHSYVLTDNDMLEFCQAWLSEQTRPRNLCAQLKDKYLLMLGCGYSDWLFRFIWFCMNKTPKSKAQGLIAKDKSVHDTLVEYLRRIDTFLPSDDPNEVVTKIVDKVALYKKTLKDEDWFSKPPREGKQVFLSYSRRDSSATNALYKYLTEHGLTVWFDKNDISGGSKFKEEIKDAIANSKVFVPILSENINKEAMNAHEYRNEWDIAINLQKRMGKRNFILPVHLATDDFDFYKADIPDGIRERNSIPINGADSFSEVLNAIKMALYELDNFNTDFSV